MVVVAMKGRRRGSKRRIEAETQEELATEETKDGDENVYCMTLVRANEWQAKVFVHAIQEQNRKF